MSHGNKKSFIKRRFQVLWQGNLNTNVDLNIGISFPFLQAKPIRQSLRTETLPIFNRAELTCAFPRGTCASGAHDSGARVQRHQELSAFSVTRNRLRGPALPFSASKDRLLHLSAKLDRLLFVNFRNQLVNSTYLPPMNFR